MDISSSQTRPALFIMRLQYLQSRIQSYCRFGTARSVPFDFRRHSLSRGRQEQQSLDVSTVRVSVEHARYANLT